MKKALLACIILLSLLLTGCKKTISTPTPPPGWRDPVYQLLLHEDSFPDGWDAGGDIPEYIKDVTTNRVAMEWLHDNGGLVYQAIWRAYSIEDAKTRFAESKQERYGPYRTHIPDIKFDHINADEFYIACGGLKSARCVTIARYRNYVTALTADLSGTIGDYTQDKGLTYAQIEALIRDMDKIFDTIQK